MWFFENVKPPWDWPERIAGQRPKKKKEMEERLLLGSPGHTNLLHATRDCIGVQQYRKDTTDKHGKLLDDSSPDPALPSKLEHAKNELKKLWGTYEFKKVETLSERSRFVH